MTSTQLIKNCKHLLYNQIENAANTSDLMPLLQSFDLDYLKKCIKTKLEQEGTDAVLKSHFRTTAIHKIFNTDITQNILSFIHSNNEKLVNKTFEKCVENNERNLMKQRNEAIEKLKPFTHEIKYDNNKNSTWIVHHSRFDLTDNERKLGYKGPIQNLIDAIHCSEDNDKILIKCVENMPRLSYRDSAIEINKNLQIIAVGNDVILKDIYIAPIMINIGNETNCNVYFENITFDFDNALDATEGSIHVSDGSSLWMKSCKVYNRYYAIMVCKNANLHIQNCEFRDGASTIVVSPIANNVNIIGSTFENCANPIIDDCTTEEFSCIDITDEYSDMRRITNDAEIIAKLLKLKCIGNIFFNNRGQTVAASYIESNDTNHSDIFLSNFNEYELKHNILKGYNLVDNANALYHF